MGSTYRRFLDQGSITTLCDQNLPDRLGISGGNKTFVLTTVNEMMRNHDGHKTSLIISGLNDDREIKLKDVFSVEELPIKPNSTLSSEDSKAWPHLKESLILSLAASVSLLSTTHSCSGRQKNVVLRKINHTQCKLYLFGQ